MGAFIPQAPIDSVNQILAAVVLFGVVTAILAPLIAETGSQISGAGTTIADVVDSSRQRTGQVMVSTHIQSGNNDTSIYVSSIGTEDIEIHAILIDGIEVSFVLYNQNSDPIKILEADSLGVLGINGTGSKVQVITTAGKIFEYSIT